LWGEPGDLAGVSEADPGTMYVGHL
jgi:hypothetical protein